MPTPLTVLLACLLGACVDWPQPPAPARPSGMSVPNGMAPPCLRFGAWNVRKLGADSEQDLSAIARVIEGNFDLIALLEVMWSEHDAALAPLLSELGAAWAAQITDTALPAPPSQYSEYYAVLYRPAQVAPCAELPALRFLSQDAPGPSSLHFLREPAFGCYRAAGVPGGSDFVLAVYHARWGSGAADEIAGEVRQTDAVLRELAERLPGERQLFMLGDFNLTPEQLAPLTQASDRTRGQGSTLSANGQPSAHLYDHLLAFGSAADSALEQDATVLDVRAEANDPAAFRARVSDHLPIRACLRLSPDAD
jgi:endonuclease/exonuclease/phosphatase family metal-dependent hydrolase